MSKFSAIGRGNSRLLHTNGALIQQGPDNPKQTGKILQEELPVCKILVVYCFVKLDSEILSFKQQLP